MKYKQKRTLEICYIIFFVSMIAVTLSTFFFRSESIRIIDFIPVISMLIMIVIIIVNKNSMEKCVKSQELCEIREAYNYQKSNGWTFYNEWGLINSALHSRCNFLLLAYSLFLNAYFTVQYCNEKILLLVIGFIIANILSIGIFRAYTRAKIILDILRKLDPKDVQPFVDIEYKAKSRMYNILPNSRAIGVILPFFIWLSFVVGLFYYIVLLPALNLPF